MEHPIKRLLLLLIHCIWKNIYLNCGVRYEDMIDHLRYWCSALPTELSSQLGANHVVSSIAGEDASDYMWLLCVGHQGIIINNNQQLTRSLLFINAMLKIQRTAKILICAVAFIKIKLQMSDLCNFSTVYML